MSGPAEPKDPDTSPLLKGEITKSIGEHLVKRAIDRKREKIKPPRPMNRAQRRALAAIVRRKAKK
jgi:hypothetical protein